jgi:hypothetical protein
MNNPSLAGDDRPEPSPAQAQLQGDAARQAAGLFKGIAYQVWQTVLAWTDLKEDEILVVEGAEDFDLIRGNEGIGNQVKAIASPISLRSDCVCDALRNLWTTRHKNPSRVISLRLITTAPLNIEAHNPLGANKPGLQLWNEESLRSTPDVSARLRDFLITDTSVSKKLAEPFGCDVPSLIEHLRQLSPDRFHTEFVRQAQWLSNQPDIEVIRETVRYRLHAYGESKHLLPRDSDRSLTPLFDHIVRVTMRERRNLTRADFRVQFDDATRTTLPLSQFNQAQAVLAGRLDRFPSTSEVTYSLSEISSIPDLPILCAKRTKLVETLAFCVSEHGFIAIQGSTGKGKSTLGNMVARRHGGSWRWISFARWETGRISEALQGLARDVAGSSQGLFLFLDDLNPSGADAVALLQRLAVLSRLTLSSNGRIIVTTQRMLGNVFLRQSNLPPIVLQEARSFHLDEVKDLCSQAGCPDDVRLSSSAAIMLAQTGGHPQLVHARVKVASRGGWPAFAAKDLLQVPEELSDERKLARELLSELQDGEIELLHRLSLASGSFRKDHAIAVAEIAPRIPRPGDKFDALVGPWIEPAAGRYFRLSTLLSNAAAENWSEGRIKEMRAFYGQAVYRAGTLTLIEASEILFQAIQTLDHSLAVCVLVPVMLAPPQLRNAWAKGLQWIRIFLSPEKLFPKSQFVGLLFRLAQFRVAVETNERAAAQLAARLWEETRNLSEPESTTVAANEIVLAIQILVPPAVGGCWGVFLG